MFRALPAATAAGLLFLAGCHVDLGDSDRFQEPFHHSYAVTPGARLVLENGNGEVDISTWEKNEVELNGHKFSSSEADLARIRVDISASRDSIRVRTDKPNYVRGGAHYRIRVPVKMMLDRVKTTNGEIKVSGVDGKVNVETTNGGLHISRTSGVLSARTTNGGINVYGHSGDAEVETTNGEVDLEAKKGNVAAKSTNGKLNLQLAELVTTRPIRLETTNGEIEVSLDAARELRANTTNSSITLKLPADAGAELRAVTSHARVDCEFVPDQRGGDEDDRRRLSAKIGKGGPVIDLSTSHGDIRILKR
jgi:hypothetical protein